MTVPLWVKTVNGGDSTPFNEPLWMAPGSTKQLADALAKALVAAGRYTEGRFNLRRMKTGDG